MTPSLILRDEAIRQRAIDRIKALKLDAEEPWGVYIAPYRKLRTLEANARYWSIVGRICAATGRSKNVVHTLIRKMAWGMEIEQVGDRLVEAVASSREAERGNFSELIDTADQLAAEMGIE